MPGVFVPWRGSLGLGEGEHSDLVSVGIQLTFFSFLNLFVFCFSKTELGNRTCSISSFPLDKAEFTTCSYRSSTWDVQQPLAGRAAGRTGKSCPDEVSASAVVATQRLS